jgi:beta-phosphoglucomutase-like phosphatase (HAD superfamily)
VRKHSALVQRPYPDPAWRFYTAFLFFKNAVVLQGVEARRRQGVASSKLAIKLLDLAPVLVDISSTHLAELGDETARTSTSASASASGGGGDGGHAPAVLVVVFDWGGVLTQSSPLRAIRDFEQLHHLPKGYVSVAIHAAGDRHGLFQRLERGACAGRWKRQKGQAAKSDAMSMLTPSPHTPTHPHTHPLPPHTRAGEFPLDEAFFQAFETELTSKRSQDAYRQIAEKIFGMPPPSALSASSSSSMLPGGQRLDARALLRYIMQASAAVDEGMLAAVRRLKEAGVRTAVLTNDFRVAPGVLAAHDEQPALEAMERVLRDRALFDAVVSSAATGSRKPEPRMYDVLCQTLGVAPQDCLFLDDIGRNLKAARALGMRTLLVREDNKAEVLAALAGVARRAEETKKAAVSRL